MYQYRITLGVDIPAFHETVGEFPNAISAVKAAHAALPSETAGWRLVEPKNSVDVVKITVATPEGEFDETPDPLVSMQRIDERTYTRRTMRDCIEITKLAYANDPALSAWVARMEKILASI